MPNLTVIRPADANKVSMEAAIANRRGRDVGIIRRGLQQLDRNQFAAAARVQKGDYILAPETGELQLILLASGS